MSTKIKFGSSKKDFLPIPDRKTAKQLYTDWGYLEEWKRFANVSKNYFMRKMLRNVQSSTCAYCGKLLLPSMSPTVHHKSYMCLCFQDNSVNYDAMSIPDCETCFFEHKERFFRCMSCLSYVHQGCHYIIHKETIEKSSKL